MKRRLFGIYKINSVLEINNINFDCDKLDIIKNCIVMAEAY